MMLMAKLLMLAAGTVQPPMERRPERAPEPKRDSRPQERPRDDRPMDRKPIPPEPPERDRGPDRNREQAKPNPVDRWILTLIDNMTDPHDTIRDSARAGLVTAGHRALPHLRGIASECDSAKAVAAQKVMAEIVRAHGAPPGSMPSGTMRSFGGGGGSMMGGGFGGPDRNPNPPRGFGGPPDRPQSNDRKESPPKRD
jgi:hypothetical protein